MSETPIARRVLERLRRQVRSKVANLAAFREGNKFAEGLQNSVVTPETLKAMHPAHAIYVHVQNQMSVMAEQLLELPEMRAFAKIIGEAHDEYMPSWPPMSPISTSYFWCWLTFDAIAHRETVGSVTLRIAAEFGVLAPSSLACMSSALAPMMSAACAARSSASLSSADPTPLPRIETSTASRATRITGMGCRASPLIDALRRLVMDDRSCGQAV